MRIPTFGEVRSGRLLAISPTYRRRSIHELNKRLPANALPIDEKIDIVLEYPRAFLKANGEQVGAFDLELGGISGELLPKVVDQVRQ